MFLSICDIILLFLLKAKLYVLNEKDKNRLKSKIDNYILQFDLSSAGFTFLLSRVHLKNYSQCGFGGMQLKIELNLKITKRKIRYDNNNQTVTINFASSLCASPFSL